MKIMNHTLKYLKWVLIATIVFLVFPTLSDPFNGKSTFATTTLYYTIALFIPLLLLYLKKINLSPLLIFMLSLVMSLYFAEVILRYIVKYPITYSESQWGNYVTLYDFPYSKPSYFQRLSGHKSNYHLHILKSNKKIEYKTPEFAFPDETANDFGLRGIKTSPNKKIIIALGDSFTESWGAPGDSTYPVLLQSFISKTDTSKQILNAGVSGSDPFFEFELLKKLAEKDSIEAAVFMINSSDITDVMIRGGAERFLPNGQLKFCNAPWWEPIYAVSFVFRLCIHNLGKYNYNLMTQKQEDTESLKAINTIVSYFDTAILPWAAAKNIKVYIVLQPMILEVKKTTHLYNEMDRQLSTLKTNYLNLSDSLQATKQIDNYYWPKDGHFNSKGYELISRFIYETFFSNDTIATTGRMNNAVGLDVPIE